MQGFVFVGFAIVAVGLALNKLWDSLFWWWNFQVWDLQLMNLHWTSCGICSCGCGIFVCDTCNCSGSLKDSRKEFHFVSRKDFHLGSRKVFHLGSWKGYWKDFHRVLGRIFLFSWNKPLLAEIGILSHVSKEQRVEFYQGFVTQSFFCWNNPSQAGFGNW